MLKKSIILITLVAFTNLLLGGCTKVVTHQIDETSSLSDSRILSVITKTGEEFKFVPPGGSIDLDQKVVTGVTGNWLRVEIALDDVDQIRTRESAPGKTLILTGVIVGAAVALLAVGLTMKDFGDDTWN